MKQVEKQTENKLQPYLIDIKKLRDDVQGLNAYKSIIEKEMENLEKYLPKRDNLYSSLCNDVDDSNPNAEYWKMQFYNYNDQIKRLYKQIQYHIFHSKDQKRKIREKNELEFIQRLFNPLIRYQKREIITITKIESCKKETFTPPTIEECRKCKFHLGERDTSVDCAYLQRPEKIRKLSRKQREEKRIQQADGIRFDQVLSTLHGNGISSKRSGEMVLYIMEEWRKSERNPNFLNLLFHYFRANRISVNRTRVIITALQKIFLANYKQQIGIRLDGTIYRKKNIQNSITK